MMSEPMAMEETTVDSELVDENESGLASFVSELSPEEFQELAALVAERKAKEPLQDDSEILSEESVMGVDEEVV